MAKGGQMWCEVFRSYGEAKKPGPLGTWATVMPDRNIWQIMQAALNQYTSGGYKWQRKEDSLP